MGVPIADIIARKAPLSIRMGLMAMGLSLLLGIPLGGAMALGKSRFWDQFGTAFIVLINAVPAAVYDMYLQAYGSAALGISMLFDQNRAVSWVLPVVSMSLGSTAYYAMWLRRYMVDELNKDYVKLARAKGVKDRDITMAHVFRNAFVPLIQYIPSSLLFTVSGSIYIESLYSIPGMGGLLVDVIQRQDNPMVQTLVMIYSCIGIVGMLLGDILMVLIDPRITFARKGGALMACGAEKRKRGWSVWRRKRRVPPWTKRRRSRSPIMTRRKRSGRATPTTATGAAPCRSF